MSRFKGWTPESVAEHRHAQMIARYRDQRWPLPPVPIAGEANAADQPTDEAPIRHGFGLVLPFPPTANTYVRHITAGRHYMTAEGKAFRRAVVDAALRSKVRKVEGRLEVIIRLCPKNRKKGDLDNRIKPLLDALEHAGCFDNDEQIDRLEVSREWQSKAGDCFVTVRQLA